MWLKLVLGEFGRCSVVVRRDCVAALVSTIVFKSIDVSRTASVIYSVSNKLSFYQEKNFLAINSKTNKVTIGYFTVPSIIDLSVTQRV